MRANTSAIGTPNTRHSTVLADDVFTLSVSAASDAGLVTSYQNCDHSTLAAIATRGSTTNVAPSAAGT